MTAHRFRRLRELDVVSLSACVESSITCMILIVYTSNSAGIFRLQSGTPRQAKIWHYYSFRTANSVTEKSSTSIRSRTNQPSHINYDHSLVTNYSTNAWSKDQNAANTNFTKRESKSDIRKTDNWTYINIVFEWRCLLTEVPYIDISYQARYKIRIL